MKRTHWITSQRDALTPVPGFSCVSSYLGSLGQRPTRPSVPVSIISVTPIGRRGCETMAFITPSAAAQIWQGALSSGGEDQARTGSRTAEATDHLTQSLPSSTKKNVYHSWEVARSHSIHCEPRARVHRDCAIYDVSCWT